MEEKDKKPETPNPEELEIEAKSTDAGDKDPKTKKKEKKKDTLEDKLEQIQEELDSIKDKYFRSLAEMDNLKKRLSEEAKRDRTYASFTLSDKLIDSIEIFDQALSIETDDPQFKNFLYGFKMIKDMIYASLKEEGVNLIETKEGDVFDPITEHAVDTRYEADKPEHTILQVIKKGYKFKDRLLRPAMVVINMKPQTEPVTETGSAATSDPDQQPIA